MFYLIVNTQAGRESYKSLAKKIENQAKKLDLKIKIASTDNLLEAKKLAKAAVSKSGIKAIVAVGGNKTVNTLIGALAGSQKPLGIIPLTKGSQLARSVGIKNWQEGLKTLKNHDVSERPVGRIDKNFFLGEVRLLPKKQLAAEAKRMAQNLFSRFLKNVKLPVKNFVPVTITTGKNLSLELESPEIRVTLQADPKPTLVLRAQSKPAVAYESELHKMTPGEIKNITTTILSDQKITIKSHLPLPAVSFGEKIGVTPATIIASSKRLKILIPKEPKEK